MAKSARLMRTLIESPVKDVNENNKKSMVASETSTGNESKNRSKRKSLFSSRKQKVNICA